MFFQMLEGVQAVQDSMPSSWIDEPHEKILWAFVFAVTSYLGKQVFDRRNYERHTREAAEKLSNPRSDRTINGKTNSAQLLNYVIDDMREIRKDVQRLVVKHETLSAKVDEMEKGRE